MENNEEMITIPRAEYEAQKQQILKLEQQVSLLMEAMRLNRHKRFGASSEKTEDVCGKNSRRTGHSRHCIQAS